MTHSLPRPLQFFALATAAKLLAVAGTVGFFGTSGCTEEASALHPDAVVARAPRASAAT